MMIHTTTAIQGKEANIAFYSLVVANGHLHVDKNEPLPMGFVAGIYISKAHQYIDKLAADGRILARQVLLLHAVNVGSSPSPRKRQMLEETRTYMDSRPRLAKASFQR
jgi:hypothetical protein